MKKSTLRRLLVLALCLTLVTCTLVGTTLAKYTSSYTGNDSVTVAAWDVKVNNVKGAVTQETFVLDLAPDTHTDHVTDGKIAPGVGGHFDVLLTNSSDVAVDYILTFTVTGKPTNLVFKYGSTTLDATDGTYSVVSDGTLALTGDDATKTETVNWEWAYETADGNATDTAEGIAAGNMTVTVTVTATQHNPGTGTTNTSSTAAPAAPEAGGE